MTMVDIAMLQFNVKFDKFVRHNYQLKSHMMYRVSWMKRQACDTSKKKSNFGKKCCSPPPNLQRSRVRQSSDTTPASQQKGCLEMNPLRIT